jgi:hypothetical protein
VGLDRRPAVVLLERQRIERHVPGRSLELERLDHPVRRRRPVEHAMEAVLVALVVPVDVPPAAAIADVVLVDDHLVLAGTQPLLDQLGVRVRPKDQVARRVELAGDVDERDPGVRGDLRRGHHRLLSCSGC